jgi:hypothetical protein
MSSTFTLYLNRVVVGLNIVAGLAAAVVVPVANLDLSSAAGVLGGLAAITLACAKFLTGWQAHEAAVHEDLLLARPAKVGDLHV